MNEESNFAEAYKCFNIVEDYHVTYLTSTEDSTKSTASGTDAEKAATAMQELEAIHHLREVLNSSNELNSTNSIIYYITKLPDNIFVDRMTRLTLDILTRP